MHISTGASAMSTDTFTFEILPGINTSVTLNLEWEFIRTLEALPPHTGVMKQHASIYWGENFHGSLNETYYFTLDNASDRSCWILWVGDNGSQRDDNCPRLSPGAWILISDVELIMSHLRKKDLTEERLAAGLLLYAWILRAHERENCPEDHGEVHGSEVLMDTEIHRLLNRGINNCLELSVVLARQKADAPTPEAKPKRRKKS